MTHAIALPLLAGYWTHNLDPFVFRVSENFGVRWYGLSYLAAFVAGWALMIPLARRGRMGGVAPDELGDLVQYGALGAVLGGRLAYCLIYSLSDMLREPWRIFMIWEGGMASHGGIVGVGAALGIWWARRMRRGLQAARAPADEPPGGEENKVKAAASRAGKRAQGRPASNRRSDSPPVNTMAAQAGGGFWASFLSKDFWSMADGLSASATIGLFFGRMANFINGELWGRPADVSWAMIFPKSMPPHVPRHPSMLYEAALEGLLLFAWLYPGVWRSKWNPGGGCARFILGYAAARFFVEFYREPDEGIGYQWLHLTRGQWLTAAMAAIGIALIVYLRKKPFRASEAPSQAQ